MWDGSWFDAWEGLWFGTTEVGGEGSGGNNSSRSPRSGLYLGKRFGNVPLVTSGSGGSSSRAPIVAFSDYCGQIGIAKRFGTSGGAPIVVAPRGLCGPNGELVDGEVYLAKRFGNINGVPVVVPVCNQCGGEPTSGGSGGSGSGSGSGDISGGTSGSGSGSGSGPSGSGSGDSGSGSGGSGSGISPEGPCCQCWTNFSTTPPAAITMSIAVPCLGDTYTASLTKVSFPKCTTNINQLFWIGGTVVDYGTSDLSDTVCATGTPVAEIEAAERITMTGSVRCHICTDLTPLWYGTLTLNGKKAGKFWDISWSFPMTIASCSPLVWNQVVSPATVCDDVTSTTPLCSGGSTPTIDLPDNPGARYTSNLGCILTINASE